MYMYILYVHVRLIRTCASYTNMYVLYVHVRLIRTCTSYTYTPLSVTYPNLYHPHTPPPGTSQRLLPLRGDKEGLPTEAVFPALPIHPSPLETQVLHPCQGVSVLLRAGRL